jgi:peptidoglycan/LPS O-acetylase OafA/YrhL
MHWFKERECGTNDTLIWIGSISFLIFYLHFFFFYFFKKKQSTNNINIYINKNK